MRGARLAAGGALGSVPAERRLALAAELEPVIEEHNRLWHAVTGPAGFPNSERWLTHLHDCYATGEADRAWPDQ